MRPNISCRTTLKSPWKESSEKRIVLRRLKKNAHLKNPDFQLPRLGKKALNTT